MTIVMGYLTLSAGDLDRLRPAIAHQVGAARASPGCEDYVFALDLTQEHCLLVAERWRDRAAQSAHLVGDHMAEWNIAMRAARIVAAHLDSYDGGMVRRLLEIPAQRFRAEYHEPDQVVGLRRKRLPGRLSARTPVLAAIIADARAADGCRHFACARDVLDPDGLVVAQRWRDAAAHAAFGATPAGTMLAGVLADDNEGGGQGCQNDRRPLDAHPRSGRSAAW